MSLNQPKPSRRKRPRQYGGDGLDCCRVRRASGCEPTRVVAATERSMWDFSHARTGAGEYRMEQRGFLDAQASQLRSGPRTAQTRRICHDHSTPVKVSRATLYSHTGGSIISALLHPSTCRVYPSTRPQPPTTSSGPQLLARLQSSRLTGILKRLDTWITWAVVGIAIGIAFGANLTAVWLVAVGLIVFVAYLHLTGPVRAETEGRRFASGGVFMIAWIAGFVIKGLLL